VVSQQFTYLGCGVSHVNRKRYIGYRLLWAGVASFIVTVVLFLIALSIGELASGARASFGDAEVFWQSDEPAYVQYFDWVQSLVTLDWGTSQRFGKPVTSLLAERAPVTAAYLVPAVLIGTLVSTTFGYIAALKRGQWSDRLIRTVSYLLLAVPNFLIGALLVGYFERRIYEIDGRFYELEASIFTKWNLFWLLLATVILGTHVAAVQIRQVRTQSTEYFDTDMTQQLRAKGVGSWRFARHILRAAAVPLTSLFVAEVLGLLLVSVFVMEAVLRIPGLGEVAWRAVSVNDGPVALTVTFLIAFTIILASVLEDIVAIVFDPRLAAEE
jgi:peptide/nickel transport system permease protein